MVSVPPNIQYQLGDAIGVIANSDFWERWDTLVDVRRGDLEARAFKIADRFLGSSLSPNSGQPYHQ